MGQAVNLDQFLDVHVGVNLRRIEPCVTEHFLHIADIRAIFQHQCRHCMAEQMAAATLTDTALLDVAMN